MYHFTCSIATLAKPIIESKMNDLRRRFVLNTLLMLHALRPYSI